MKIFRVMLLLAVGGSFFTANAQTKSLVSSAEDGSICTAIIHSKGNKRQMHSGEIRVHRNGELIAQASYINNVGQEPESLLLNDKCELVAIYPAYEGRFQNVYLNGKHRFDIDVQ